MRKVYIAASEEQNIFFSKIKAWWLSIIFNLEINVSSPHASPAQLPEILSSERGAPSKKDLAAGTNFYSYFYCCVMQTFFNVKKCSLADSN